MLTRAGMVRSHLSLSSFQSAGTNFFNRLRETVDMTTNVTMLFGQSFNVTIKATDSAGNVQPLPVGSVVSFTANNPNAVAIKMNADGVSATATAIGTAGGPAASSQVVGTLTWSDIGGTHTLSTPADVVVVGNAPSTIAAIGLVNGTPA
jgi:hypothetical protein